MGLNASYAGWLFANYLSSAYNATVRAINAATSFDKEQLSFQVTRFGKFGFPSSAHAICKEGADMILLERVHTFLYPILNWMITSLIF